MVACEGNSVEFVHGDLFCSEGVLGYGVVMDCEDDDKACYGFYCVFHLVVFCGAKIVNILFVVSCILCVIFRILIVNYGLGLVIRKGCCAKNTKETQSFTKKKDARMVGLGLPLTDFLIPKTDWWGCFILFGLGFAL